MGEMSCHVREVRDSYVERGIREERKGKNAFLNFQQIGRWGEGRGKTLTPPMEGENGCVEKARQKGGRVTGKSG